MSTKRRDPARWHKSDANCIKIEVGLFHLILKLIILSQLNQSAQKTGKAELIDR